MLVRNKTLALISIILLAILYLNYDSNGFESKEFPSKNAIKTKEKNNKPLLEIPRLTKASTVSSAVKKNHDFGIFQCLPDFNFDEEAHIEKVKQYYQSLDNSFNDASPLYYALYAKPPKGSSKLDLLFEYYNQFPNNPIVSMDMISLCINSSDERCTASFVNDAISIDMNNGAIWVSAISFYAAKGNDEAVITSIDELYKTALFNERLGERALQYAQGLEGTPFDYFNENAMIGLGKSGVPIYSPITRWCKQGLGQTDKINACLTLGEQLETRSKTLISKHIGMSLQRMVFESQGNTEAIQLIEKKKEELTLTHDSQLYQKASLMLMLDERLMHKWLNNIDFYGEIESQQLLAEEAEILYELNENHICTLIYETLDVF